MGVGKPCTLRPHSPSPSLLFFSPDPNYDLLPSYPHWFIHFLYLLFHLSPLTLPSPFHFTYSVFFFLSTLLLFLSSMFLYCVFQPSLSPQFSPFFTYFLFSSLYITIFYLPIPYRFLLPLCSLSINFPSFLSLSLVSPSSVPVP